MINIVAILVSFFSSILAIKVLLPVAPHVGLIDRPSARKNHDGAIPLVGGISIFTGVLIASSLFIENSSVVNLYLISSALIVFLGTLDDIYDLSVISRMIFQLIVASILVFGAGIYISDFGALFGAKNIDIGVFGMIFTLLACIVAINAFNMIDGIDGLAGSMSIVTLTSTAILMWLNSSSFAILLPVLIIVSIIPFLFYNVSTRNLRGKKIFMGDAGSMYMGLTVIWLLTIGTQDTSISESSFRPVTALWIIAVPLMDMLAIMIRRLIKGASPFKADNGHLHHICLSRGLSPRKTLWVICSLSIVCALFGVYGEVANVPEWLMFVSFILLFVGYTKTLVKYCVLEDKKKKAI